MAGLKRVLVQDKNIQLIQDNVASALLPLQNSPLTGGNMLTGVNLTSSQDNLVKHGLQTVPKFFIVTQQNANSTVWSPISASLSNQSASTAYINLQCSASCTISVWVA